MILKILPVWEMIHFKSEDTKKVLELNIEGLPYEFGRYNSH